MSLIDSLIDRVLDLVRGGGDPRSAGVDVIDSGISSDATGAAEEVSTSASTFADKPLTQMVEAIGPVEEGAQDAADLGAPGDHADEQLGRFDERLADVEGLPGGIEDILSGRGDSILTRVLGR